MTFKSIQRTIGDNTVNIYCTDEDEIRIKEAKYAHTKYPYPLSQAQESEIREDIENGVLV